MTDNGAILVTGATGLVGFQLIRLLLRQPRRLYVFARGESPGTESIRKLAECGALNAVWGDLTRSDLGLPKTTLAELAREVTCLVHAAGDYRLSASRGDLWSCNVDGFRNLLRHARSWPLSEFHHVSSIVVAGAEAGLVSETRLARPKRFLNLYEESKWTAETILLDWASLPTRLYRLGIVVGDSANGMTQKFDGPYAAFGLMWRHAPFVLPGSGENLFPLVTVDLAAEVLAAGIGCPPRACEFMHVIDTDPPTVREFAEAMMERIAGHRRVFRLPERVFRAIASFPGFETLTGLEQTACEYMCSKNVYSVSGFAEFCREAGIRSNRMKSAYDVVAAYYATAKGRPFRPQDA